MVDVMSRESALELVQWQPVGTHLISHNMVIVKRSRSDGEIRWFADPNSKLEYEPGYPDRTVANTLYNDMDGEAWCFS